MGLHGAADDTREMRPEMRRISKPANLAAQACRGNNWELWRSD